jgi:hypothetical protein
VQETANCKVLLTSDVVGHLGWGKRRDENAVKSYLINQTLFRCLRGNRVNQPTFLY